MRGPSSDTNELHDHEQPMSLSKSHFPSQIKGIEQDCSMIIALDIG